MMMKMELDQSTKLPESVDVLVIGAGIVGLASAYHIKQRNPSLRVLLIEKAQAAGQGDTAKSAAGVRNIFSSEISRELSDSSIAFYKAVQEKRGIPLGLRFISYLWLMTENQFHQFQESDEKMTKSGDFKIWMADELKSKMPRFRATLDRNDKEIQMMGLEDIAAGIQGIRCGIIAVEKLVSFYEDEFRKSGGEIAYGLPVEKIIVDPVKRIGIEGEPFEWQNKAIVGARTPRGEIRVRLKTVIALGAWGRELLDPIGVDCHMNPVRKMLFVLRAPKIEPLLNTPGFNKDNVIPLTILPKSGVYVRPVLEERSLYTSMTEGIGHSFVGSENPPVDERLYVYNVNPVLSAYFPDLRGIRPYTAWAGRQDWSSTDKNPYVFEKANAIIAIGTTGNGISKADAIGRIVAGLTLGEQKVELYGNLKFDASKVDVATRVIQPEIFALA
jgi:glycine/D-amino acid oxidase-like deaminating enzyme